MLFGFAAEILCYNLGELQNNDANERGIMSNAQITIRAKKLGLLIRDARLAERRSVKECAEALGIKNGLFRSYEEGTRSPSLPELETLVFYLKISINKFWGKEVESDASSPVESLDTPRLIALRHRMIGVLLRQERTRVNMTVKHISDETAISQSRLKAYELGSKPVPLPELEMILDLMGSRIESFFDRSGPIGEWMTSQEAMQRLLDLPVEIQEFVCRPVNRPYLELAMKLSSMSKDKLRSVAEGLLDITL